MLQRKLQHLYIIAIVLSLHSQERQREGEQSLDSEKGLQQFTERRFLKLKNCYH